MAQLFSDLFSTIASDFPSLLPLVAGYLMGSVPFGLLLARWWGVGDLRQQGSGNIGATNALRAGGRGLGGLTLLLDLGKGLGAVMLARHMGWGLATVGVAAVIGHIAPVWLKFRGGKGVATYMGVLLGWCWPVGCASVVIWLVVMGLTRTSSKAGLAACLASLPLMAMAGSANFLPIPLPVMLPLVCLIVYRHKDNIFRLFKKEEKKL